MTEERLYFYPVVIRLWHLINAVLCLLLILTGISMQFSNPQYPMIRFDVAVSIHNIAGILLIISYFIFILGNIITKNWRYYKIKPRGMFASLKLQFIYYTRGIFEKMETPFPLSAERKFNPLQLFTYLMIMVIVFPFLMITGIFMLYPEIFIPTKILGISALHLTDLLHITLGFIVSVFMFVHVYFCTIGRTPLSNFKGMITGYHE
jgi:thiosulfate reductase cytochrome b subunit